MEKKIHYGWIVIFMGLIATVTAHGFGRMAYTLLLPAMKDGLGFDYTQLGLLGTANFIGYLSMALIGGFCVFLGFVDRSRGWLLAVCVGAGFLAMGVGGFFAITM